MSEYSSTRGVAPLAGSMLTAVVAMSTVVGISLPGGNLDSAWRDRPVVPFETGRNADTIAASAQKVEPKRSMTREVRCLASAIWHEAGNQEREGRVAVAEVVIARMHSGRYPSKACAVIAQKSQFSFVRRGIIPPVPAKQIREMTAIALAVLDGRERSSVRGALWFHATYVNPRWKVPRIGTVGQHVFYGERVS